MTKSMCALWLAAGVVIAGTLTHGLSATGEQTVPSPRQFIKASDKQIREWAITSPPPEYPRASLAKRVTGVVVAAVLFNEKGTTEAVDIIQSPDAETGSAVRDAVMQWKIKPMMAGLVAKATLAFYFHMKGRDGVVLNPAEMRAVISPGAKNVKREDEPPVKQITEAEFRALSTQSSTLLLDIRDRETFGEGHEKGAVNIPFEEVLLRGPAELPVARHIVIDCRDPLDLCAMNVHWLVSNGFGQVSILRR
jgi:TonB family protein